MRIAAMRLIYHSIYIDRGRRQQCQMKFTDNFFKSNFSVTNFNFLTLLISLLASRKFDWINFRLCYSCCSRNNNKNKYNGRKTITKKKIEKTQLRKPRYERGKSKKNTLQCKREKKLHEQFLSRLITWELVSAQF